MKKWRVNYGDQFPTNIYEKQVREMSPEDQHEFMRDWFTQNYTNPIDAGYPTDDDTGRLLFFYGGPYEPYDQLTDQFKGIVPDRLIKALAEELTDESVDWDGVFDDSIVDDLFPNTQYHKTVIDNLIQISSLLSISIPDELESGHHRMLYIAVITAMETYLADAFITNVFSNERYIRQFVASTPEYKHTPIALAEIFTETDNIQERVRKTLQSVIWHNLDKVLSMYKDTFGLEAPKRPSAIFKAISIRHDLVHRNGKDKEGRCIDITQSDIMALLDAMRAFINVIDSQLCDWADVNQDI